MAIMYSWYENPNASGEENVMDKGLHPRPIMNGKMTMKQIYREVQRCSSLSVGDVMSAIDNLTFICGRELSEGREVHIEGLGYFSPTLETTEKVTRATKQKHLKVRLKGVSFRPDAKLKEMMLSAKVATSRYANHSSRLSDEAIEAKLTEFFAEHDVLIRVEFQRLCGMTRSTANSYLRRLREAGKLKNVGRPTQPIYCPVAGNYGATE